MNVVLCLNINFFYSDTMNFVNVFYTLKKIIKKNPLKRKNYILKMVSSFINRFFIDYKKKSIGSQERVVNTLFLVVCGFPSLREGWWVL